MDSRKIALHETAIVAAGEAAGVVIMLVIYTMLGKFHSGVLLGALMGGLLAVLNFFGMAVVATLAADRAEQQDVAGGQKLLKSSYPLRLLCLLVTLVVCAKSGFFDVLALVLPLAFVRPVITLAEFIRK